MEYDESIFITYANTPLKNNPEGLYSTLGQIEKCLPPLFSEIKEKVETLIEVDKLPFSKRLVELYGKGYKAFLKKMEEDAPRIRDIQREETFYDKIADYESHYRLLSSKEMALFSFLNNIDGNCEIIIDVLPEIYGARLMGCQYNNDKKQPGCRWGGVRNKIFETKDLRCYECDHEHFVYILDALIEERKYSEIAGLKSLVDSYQPPKTILRIPNGENSRLVETLDLNGIKLGYGGSMSFPRIFYGAVTQSLLEFLAHRYHNKLKRCSVCKKIFVPNHSRRDICSEECHDLYMRDYLREYMRKKRDKEGSDFDPRYV